MKSPVSVCIFVQMCECYIAVADTRIFQQCQVLPVKDTHTVSQEKTTLM